MHMVEKILNNTTPYGKIRASHEGSLHSSTLIGTFYILAISPSTTKFPIWFLKMSTLRLQSFHVEHYEVTSSYST